MYLARDVRKVVRNEDGEPISQDLLSEWHRLGLVQATEPATGSGTRNRYSPAKICQITLYKKFIDRGFRRQEASRLAFDDQVERCFEQTLEAWDEEPVNALAGPPMYNLVVMNMPEGHLETWVMGLVQDDQIFREKLWRTRYASDAVIMNLTGIVYDLKEKLG